MINIWEQFIKFSGGEFFAREVFDKLCFELLEIMYPGKQVVNANKIDKVEEFQDFVVVYLPKLFLDVLTTSRKGQIRKAFNNTIKIWQQKGFKLYKWIFCTSYNFNERDQKWWTQWKYRNVETYKVDIELIEGNKILELVEEFNLKTKYFDFEKKDEQKSAEIKEDKIVEQFSEEEQVKESGISEKKEEKDEKEVEKQEEIAIQSQTASEVSEEPEYKLEVYNNFFELFTLLKRDIKNLDTNQQEMFKFFRKISKYDIDNLFKSKYELDKYKEAKVLKVLNSAVVAEVNKQYDLALMLYELLNERIDEVKEQIKTKENDVREKYKNLKKLIQYIYFVALGDYLRVKGKKIEAFEQYEEAWNLKLGDKEAELKYNDILGDLLMETAMYSEAITAYENAKKILDDLTYLDIKEYKDYLMTKLMLARSIERYKKSLRHIPVVGLLFLSWIKRMQEMHKLDLISLKEFKDLSYKWGVLGAILGIIALIIIVPPLFKSYNKPQIVKNEVKRAWSLYDVAIAKGDYFMQKFKTYGYLRVHVLDSAVKSYYRAIRYDYSRKEALIKYKVAKSYLDSYIETAKRRIKQAPEKYFKPMAPYREGLQFFRYNYDPTKQGAYKFGYVDKEKNVVIPPLFDFDYHRRMKPGWESFYKGKAFVCVVINPGDTAYFQIDRTGNIRSKVYRVGYRKKY